MLSIVNKCSSMSGQSAALDIIPGSVNTARRVFSRFIAQLANLFFFLPWHSSKRNSKTVHITPLLRKIGRYDSDLANYRQMSNLNTIVKMLKLFFLSRILSHVSSSQNCNPLLSAHRWKHSTETALRKMKDDMYNAAELGRSAILIAFDMSAAFDTINNDALLQQLQHTLGIAELTLDWIRSYLHNRRFYGRWGSGQSVTSMSDIA